MTHHFTFTPIYEYTNDHLRLLMTELDLLVVDDLLREHLECSNDPIPEDLVEEREGCLAHLVEVGVADLEVHAYRPEDLQALHLELRRNLLRLATGLPPQDL
mgnify:CR=1 FL=1